MNVLKRILLCSAIVTGLTGFAHAESAAQPQPAKSYQIRNKQHGDLLRPEGARKADATPIVLHPAESWKCMTWEVSAAEGGGFQLRNHFTGKTFTAGAADPAKPASLSQVPLTANRSWQFTRLADGTFKITDPATSQALTALQDRGSSRVVVVLQPWADLNEQRWELIETDPASLTM